MNFRPKITFKTSTEHKHTDAARQSARVFFHLSSSDSKTKSYKKLKSRFKFWSKFRLPEISKFAKKYTRSKILTGRNFLALNLILAILTVQNSPIFHLADAGIYVANFTEESVTAANGLDILKYETMSEALVDTQAQFDAQTVTFEQFEKTKPDILSTGGFIEDYVDINRYGNTGPNYSNGNWWDDDGNTATPQNWRFRKCFDVSNTAPGAVNLSEYQIYLNFDTAILITAGKMLNTGADIRFVDSTGVQQDFYIADNMNTNNTRIWLQIDSLNAASTKKICMYYGYVPYLDDSIPANLPTSTSSADNTFSYSSQKNIYNIQHSGLPLSTSTQIGSYTNANNISIAAWNFVLNKYQTSTNFSFLNQNNQVAVTGPLSGALIDNATDALAPRSFAGTDFVYDAITATNTFSIYAPYANATVTIQRANGGGWSNVCVPFGVTAGNVVNTSTCTLTAGRAYRITSTAPIIVSRVSTGTNSYILYPSDNTYNPATGSYELWGVGSTLNLAGRPLSGGTCNLTVYRTSNTGVTNATAVTLNNMNNFRYTQTPGGTQGTAPAFHIVSACPIGANGVNDGDGSEAITFLPIQELDTEYLITQDTQYVAVASHSPSVSCTMYNAAGTSVDTDTTTAIGGNYADKAYFPSSNSTTNTIRYTAGYRMICNRPVFAYYEHQAVTIADEKNFLNRMQGRQKVQVEPTAGSISSSPEESLYYASGFDSATTQLYPRAYIETTIDAGSAHTYWHDLSWREITNSQSAQNGVKQIDVFYTYANSPNCTTALYPAFTNIVPETLSNVSTFPYPFLTLNTTTKGFIFPDHVSDHSCLRLRFYLQTGNPAFTPQLNSITTRYKVPTALESQTNNPVVNISANTSSKDERVRVLKVMSTNPNLNTSQSYLNFRNITHAVNFTNIDFELWEIENQILNGQFNMPPFVASDTDAATQSPIGSSNSIAVYVNHRESISSQNVNMNYKVNVASGDGPMLSRSFRINFN